MIVNTEPIIINRQAVTAIDIYPARLSAVSITLEYCLSSSWSSIGEALASLPRLQSLNIMHCDTGDSGY
jgi:hypothetical protein